MIIMEPLLQGPIIDIIGSIGTFLLACSMMPQVIKTIRDGHAKGLSSSFVHCRFIASIIVFFYGICILKIPVLAHYFFIFVSSTIFFIYKMWPKVK